MTRCFLCLFLSLMPVWLKDCIGYRSDGERIPVVEVRGHFLYLDEIQAAIPSHLSSEDSLQMAHGFIDKWVKETLLYDAASKNLMESQAIKQMVEAYRRSLIVYEFQQQALAEKMEASVTEEDIADYYANNADRFLSSKNLVRGIFIKVPLSSSELQHLKQWYTKNDEQTIERIESACFQKSIVYDNFYSEWIALDDVLDLIPYHMPDQRKFLRSKKPLCVEDESYCYLLSIDSYLEAGSPEPLEFVSARIKHILMNSYKTAFLNQFEEEMFQEAQSKNQIHYFDLSPVQPEDNSTEHE